MFYVYILRSKKDKGFYIGYSKDLKQRIKHHNEGGVDSTKDRRPLSLEYYEAYKFDKLARVRERQLKRFSSAYSALLKRLEFK